MPIGNEMVDKLNELLGACFEMNAHSDNVAYWLRFNNYVEATKEFHEKYAHEFPVLADKITEFMAKVKARPVRLACPIHADDYSNAEEAFTDVNNQIKSFIGIIKDSLELAEINDEIDSRIFLENFLTEILNYAEQADIWEDKAKLIGDDPIKFDKYFDDFTII